MKKLFLLFSAIVITASLALANNDYKINDATIDNMFANAEEINVSAIDVYQWGGIPSAAAVQGSGTTKGGFLVRAFLCGSFALHRSYMGTGGKSLWYMYCWNEVACVDFFCWVAVCIRECRNFDLSELLMLLTLD